MIRFETVNELALKVTCQGGGVLYTKAGAFIAGESAGRKNYTFEKVLFGPQQGLLQAAFGVWSMRQNQEPAGSIHSLPVSEMTASRNIW